MQHKRKSFKSVVFDMDGVLIDSTLAVETFWIKWGDKYGRQLDFKEIHGKPLEGTLSGKFFADIPEEDKQQIRQDCYDLETTMTYTALKGSNKLIQKLKEMGASLALVTSAMPFKVNKALGDLNILNCFDVIVTADMIKSGKPDPSCYLLAAEKLGVSPDECIGFEDSLAGLTAMSKAGMYAIAVNDFDKDEELKSVGASGRIAGLNDVAPVKTEDSIMLEINDNKFEVKLTHKSVI